MSAPAPATAPVEAEQPAKTSRWGKKEKAPKPPKIKKPRQPWGIAPWLLIFGILLAGGAVAAFMYPIPGLTAPLKPTDPTPEPEPPKTTPANGLAAREAEVARREADLAAREAALMAKESQVDSLLKELGATERESVSVKRVAQIYTNMAPYKAAPLMAAMTDETLLQVLRQMNPDEAAAILAYMEPTRGARILAELARPPVTNPAGG